MAYGLCIFGPVRLGVFDERQTKGRLNDYLTLKV